MTIPVPARLNNRQRPEDTDGLVLATPSIAASASDDTATVLELNGTEHRVPRDWAVAEGKHGECDLVFLRRGSEVRVLAGDREGRVHEVRGYRREVLDEIRASRFGQARKASPEATEVDRLVALSDVPGQAPAPEKSPADIDRLAAVGNGLDGGTVDDAEVARLVNLADEL